jgi:hypothetical protein
MAAPAAVPPGAKRTFILSKSVEPHQQGILQLRLKSAADKRTVGALLQDQQPNAAVDAVLAGVVNDWPRFWVTR